MKLSILITSLEDYDETQFTIRSIRETAGDVEVIVVDDASLVPLTLEDKNAILIRNEFRAGVAAARHIAAMHATGDVFLIIDAHMRFEPGWLEVAMERIRDKPTTIHCSTCVALQPGQMKIESAKSHYLGAYLKFYGPDQADKSRMQILEGCWLPDGAVDDAPISCIMGACYFISADWFWHIGGMRLLRGWGSDEALLSLKTWLAGGECRALKGVRIGHQFRAASPYRTDTWKLWYNKMMIAHTCFPDKAWSLIRLMGDLPEVATAKREIEKDANLVMSEKAYMASIQKRDLDWFCQYFNLTFPS